MDAKQAIIDAFQLKATTGSAPVPTTIFGGGVWTVRRWQREFVELLSDVDAYSNLLIQANDELRSPIIYVGSGFANFLLGALGGKLKEHEVGPPELVEPLVRQSADELDALDPKIIEKDPLIQNSREATRRLAKQIGETHIIAVTAWAPFTLAGQIYGVERMMRATMKQPAEVEKTVKFATEVVKQFYRPLLEEKTFSMACLVDPTSSGDLISGRVFERFVLASLRDLISWMKGYGVFVWLHICGNVTKSLNLIAETCADCFSLDQKVNLAKAKGVLGGKMCIAGNVDPVAYLYQGTPGSVGEACKRCIADGAAGGGFILTSGCDLPPTVKLENIQAMMNEGT